MKTEFNTLDAGDPILIQTSELENLLLYSKLQTGLRAYRMEYIGEMVKVTMTERHIIVKKFS